MFNLTLFLASSRLSLYLSLSKNFVYTSAPIGTWKCKILIMFSFFNRFGNSPMGEKPRNK